jgi:hypothetical protein
VTYSATHQLTINYEHKKFYKTGPWRAFVAVFIFFLGLFYKKNFSLLRPWNIKIALKNIDKGYLGAKWPNLTV